MEFLITLSYNAVFSRLPGVLSGTLKTIVFSKIQSHFLFGLKGRNQRADMAPYFDIFTQKTQIS